MKHSKDYLENNECFLEVSTNTTTIDTVLLLVLPLLHRQQFNPNFPFLPFTRFMIWHNFFKQLNLSFPT